MYFLMFFVILIALYIFTFKENFTQEKLDKIVPIIVIGLILSIVITILGSIKATG